ncbi:MAG TPA: PQQ-binding-like beta-propeller repeat protein [Caulifigura sp.]|nr:PQQ-binding-like beta-propeller repeat protein [Caulifigura sp.]
MTVRTFLLSIAFATAAAWAGVSQAQDAKDQLLHYSLRVDIDDDARTQFAAAETELARGDLLTAVSRWRAILDTSPADRLIPFRGDYLSIPTAVRASLRAQPRSTQLEYLRITDPIAARALATAIENEDPGALWSIIDRFPMTEAAGQACQHLAGVCFDAGEFAACRLAVDRGFDEVPDIRAALEQHPRMLAWRVLSMQALGDDADDAIWTTYSKVLSADLRQIVAASETSGLLPRPNPTRGDLSPATVTNIAELLPSEERLWSHAISDSQGVEAEWSPIISDFEELAQPLYMVNQPHVIEDGFVVSGTALHRLDRNGKLRDQQPALRGATRHRTDSVEGLRAALGESIVGRSTTGGERLFTVQPAYPRDRPDPGFSSRLDATAIGDGELSWSLTEFPRPSGRPIGKAAILGPPAVRSGLAVIAIQSDDQIGLVGLDAATSQVRWSTRLGDSGLALLSDTRRRWMPAVIDINGDSVVCATGNGAIASVNPLTGQLHWIVRTEREDWRDAGPPPVSVPTSPRFRMWTGWREPVVGTMVDVVVWAGPESNALIGVDRRTGLERWRHSRGDRLAAVVTDSALLTISPGEVQRWNPADGGLLWSAPIPAPAGSGFAAAGWYVLPLRSGGTVAVRLDNGEVTRSVAWSSEVAGSTPKLTEQFRSLSWHPSGILVQSLSSISLHRTVAEAGRGETASKSPRQLAAEGRIAEALKASTGSDAPVVQARLRSITQETAIDQFHLVDAPAERGSRTATDPQARERVEAFLVDRRAESALALFESTPLDALRTTWVESNRAPRTRLRADRLAASSLIPRSVDSPSSMSAAIAPAMQQRLDRMLEQLQQQRPGDVAGVLQLMATTDWGAARLLLHLEHPQPSAEPARDLASRRLRLLTLETLGEDVASRAKKMSAALKPQRPEITAWSPVEARPARSRPWNASIDLWSVGIDVTGPSELVGLNLDYGLEAFSRRKSGRLHFSGSGEDRPWSIDLPRNNRSLSQQSNYRHATAVGPLVIAQVGTILHGLLPFDDRGERGVTPMWEFPIDMWGQVATHSVSYLPRLSDIAPGRHPLDLDEFGRPLTQVGPVTASYFCYREFDRLVTCESSTGRRIWDHRPYDADAFAVGDHRVIALVSPKHNRVELLDALDGHVLATREAGFPARQWKGAIDSLAILRSGAIEMGEKPTGEPSGLAAVDMRTGQVKWKHALSDAAADFLVGRRLVGAVEGDAIRFFDSVTGDERR